MSSVSSEQRGRERERKNGREQHIVMSTVWSLCDARLRLPYISFAVTLSLTTTLLFHRATHTSPLAHAPNTNNPLAKAKPKIEIMRNENGVWCAVVVVVVVVAFVVIIRARVRDCTYSFNN